MTERPAEGTAAGWSVVAADRGVVLRTIGVGRPVVVLPGLEGSGESCLHLVVPVLSEQSGPALRPVLVDFAAEQHAGFDDLVTTIDALVTEFAAPDGRCDIWAQSFGTLLAASLLHRSPARLDRLVMVSAFRRLPPWKAAVAPPLLRSTPKILSRAMAPTVERWQFGPTGGNTGHPFFAALRRTSSSDMARRTHWMAGRSWDQEFSTLRPSRGRVWLGTRDRLIDRSREMAGLGQLSSAGGPDLATIAGSGHVALPPEVIATARRALSRWWSA